MTNSPDLSIIVPAHRVDDYIEECLSSLVRIKKVRVEILIVDEGEPGKTREIIDKFVALDERVKAFHSNFGGYGASVNFGLDNANGRFVAIVEGDDFIEPSALEKAFVEIQASEADMFKFTYFELLKGTVRKEDNFYRLIKKKKNDEVFLKGCLLSHFASIWSAIYKKSYIEKNNIRFVEEKGGGYVDNVFRFDSVILSNKIECHDFPFYVYRRDNPNSTTNLFSLDKMLSRWQEIHARLEKNKSLDLFLPFILTEEYWSTFHKLLEQRVTPNQFFRLQENIKKYSFNDIWNVQFLPQKQKPRLVFFKLFPYFSYKMFQTILSIRLWRSKR